MSFFPCRCAGKKSPKKKLEHGQALAWSRGQQQRKRFAAGVHGSKLAASAHKSLPPTPAPSHSLHKSNHNDPSGIVDLMACTCRNISSDGTPETASPWVQSVLGDCIYTPMEWFRCALSRSLAQRAARLVDAEDFLIRAHQLLSRNAEHMLLDSGAVPAALPQLQESD